MEGNEDESLVTNIVSATRFAPADVLEISQAGADIYWYKLYLFVYLIFDYVSILTTWLFYVQGICSRCREE